MKRVQFQLKAGAEASKVGHWKVIIGCKSKAKNSVYRSEHIPFLTECVVQNQEGERYILWYQEKKPNKINYLKISKQYPPLRTGSKEQRI